ncbi:MAG: aminotransferase class I/II-fold pyridoxal phosphate-dependent enzyme [Acidimicrobiia bacterium]
MPRAVYRVVQGTDNVTLVALDAGIVAVSWLLAFVAGFESQIPHSVQGYGWLVIGLPVVIQVSVHKLAGLYGPVWRFASIEEGLRVITAVAVGAVASSAALAVVSRVVGVDLPMFTTPAVAALLMLLGCGGVRFQARLFALERQRSRDAGSVRALIVGAGSQGAALAYELSQTDSGRDVHVVGFVDDDPQLRRRSVRGIPVLGDTTEIEALCEAHAVDRVLIALPDVDKEATKPIVERALRTTAQVKVLRPNGDPSTGMLRNVRDIDLSDLLGRQPAPVDSGDIAGYLEGSTVMVTGAGGSIGSEICRQVARYGPKRLLLVDRDETLLHEVAVGPLAEAETVLLDITDRGRLTELLESAHPEVVFHAAANKHVPILERHAAVAATTNVLSTWWLANAAAENGCKRFVHLSTDKAAHPCSVMGATKRAAEHVVVGVGRRYGLPFVAVRFGNVLGSRGSVVPTFLRQILDGGPVTVTSPEMTRYFMTIPEAVSLVLQSGAMAHDGPIFLLDMGEPASILGLARQMIRLAGLRPDHDIAIEITGARAGERLHERLHDEAEELNPASHPSISGLRPKVSLDWARLVRSMDDLEQACRKNDDTVRGALIEMLRWCGVDCRLDQATGTGGSEEPSEPTVVIDLTIPGGGITVGEAPAPPPGMRSPRVEGVSELDLAAPPRTGRLAGGLALLTGLGPHCALPFARPARPDLDRVMQRVEASYQSGALTNGRLVRELEERVAERLQVEHVVAVASCTSGLMLAVQALVEGRRGPVVLPSFTFSATAHAVAWNARTPRFVECDPSTFQIDVDDVAAALTGASAVIATHIFGAPCTPEVVESLASAAGVPVLFDAAHAFGALSHGRPIGGFGDAEVFSLTPTKPLVAGEGGLIATNDSALAERLRLGRDYGNPGDYDTQFVGLNARMSELHAAVALESLAMFDRTLERRREIARRYVAGLRDVPGIRVQAVPAGHLSTYKDFTVTVDADDFGIDRDQLVTVLAAQGIDTRNYFDPPVHHQHAYRCVETPELPVTDSVSRSVVSLPIYPDLALTDVDHVVDTIRLAHEHAEAVSQELASSRVDRLLI